MIRYYFHIYKTLFRLNMQHMLAYRMGFMHSVLSSLLWGLFSILSVYFLTAKTGSIYGLSREELLILAGLYSIFMGSFHMLFSRNFEQFSRLIDKGSLDTLLVRPIDGQFAVSVWYISFAHLFRIVLGVAFTLYILSTMSIEWGWIQMMYSFLLLISGLLIMYAVWFMIACIMIWYPRVSNIVELLFNVTSISRYPIEMYRELGQYIFFFLLPLLLIINTPAKLLVGRASVFDVIFYFFTSVLLLLLARLMWLFAIRHYTGASG